MSLAAGKLDRRVTFERAVITTNDYNEQVETWAPIGTVWAQVSFGTGVERREAAQTAASAPATFRVRHSALIAGLTEKDRIGFMGAIWNIVSRVPFGAPNEAWDITAVRQA